MTAPRFHAPVADVAETDGLAVTVPALHDEVHLGQYSFTPDGAVRTALALVAAVVAIRIPDLAERLQELIR